MKGKFITFEGCEGAGKSRQLKFLTEELDKLGIDYIVTREPGGAPVAEIIRAVILDKNNEDMTAKCEALLYAAARIQHVEQTVRPALEKGKLVVCDRYIDSSFAYQSVARGLGFSYIERLNEGIIYPDLTLFFDLPPAEAFMRKGGAEKNDRIEQSGMEFHEKVYAGYKEVLRRFPERVVAVDCRGSKEQTHVRVMAILKDRGVI